jgi:hypothetical protein
MLDKPKIIEILLEAIKDINEMTIGESQAVMFTLKAFGHPIDRDVETIKKFVEKMKPLMNSVDMTALISQMNPLFSNPNLQATLEKIKMGVEQK